MLKKLACVLALLIVANPAGARFPRGSIATSGFNGGKWQINLNFSSIGYDYPFTDNLKNAQNWSLSDNSGQPSPADLNTNGFPLNGSDAIVNHGGVFTQTHIPAAVNGGLRYVLRATGKGTLRGLGTVINSSDVASSTATVTTGSTTTVTFSQAQDYHIGQEVLLNGTTGVTATNGGGGSITSGGTTGAWTVCASGFTATTIQLCLNDQITKLTTSGAAGGTTTVDYGRFAIGVATKGRVVIKFAEPLNQQPNPGISATDATIPITDMAFIRQGSEEARWDQWKAGTCDSCQFGADFLAKLRSGNPGVIRDLNVLDANGSLETTWETRKPTTYFSYASDQYVNALPSGKQVWAGTTTSALNDYAATAGTGGPTDKRTISFAPDYTAVTVANGAAAQITFPAAHGMATGQPFNLLLTFGGSAPGGASATAGAVPVVYYAINVDATHIRFATSYANALSNTSVTTSSTGSGVVAHSTVVPCAATTTGGGSANITWANCNTPAINDPVAFFGTGATTPLATELSQWGTYYVKTVVGSVITVAKTPGGTAVTVAGTGTAGTGVRSPTFNLNGTGAVPIVDFDGWGLTLNHGNAAIAARGGNNGNATSFGTLIYDGVMGVWLKTGADYSSNTVFLYNRWPPETFQSLSNAIGAYAWWVSPTHTLDPMTDYMPSLMATARATEFAGAIPRFEVTNETWNSQFQATQIGRGHAYFYGQTNSWAPTTDPVNDWIGKVGSALGQAANVVFGGALDSTAYQVVVGVQTSGFSDANALTNNAPRLTAAQYVLHGPLQSPLTGSFGTITFAQEAASNWITHVASAQYFNSGYYGTDQETALAASYNGGFVEASISGNAISVISNTVGTLASGASIIQGFGITSVPITVSGAGPTNFTLSSTLPFQVADTLFSYYPSGSIATSVQTYVDSTQYTATATATINGTSMVVSGTGLTGHLFAGNFLFGAGVSRDAYIFSGPSGVTNSSVSLGAGTYVISPSQPNLGSISIQTANPFSLTGDNRLYGYVKDFAHTYTNSSGQVLRLNGYEGGWSPDFASSGRSQIDQLRAASKLNTSTPIKTNGLQDWVGVNIANAKANSIEFPSLFQFTGNSPATDSWSALNDLYQPTPTPYWNGYANCSALGNC
jgi:hypothetical protein